LTLSLAWIRSTKTGDELCFASDSRLVGGGNVDQCQKVFALPREDCAISFCGSTDIAYPFILQLINSIAENRKMFHRAVDVDDLKGRVVALLNRFITSHAGTHPISFVDELSKTEFLFGGHSWKRSRFRLWHVFFDVKVGRYVAGDCYVWKRFGVKRRQAALVGFCGNYVPDFLTSLEAKLAPQRSTLSPTARLVLDVEPLQTLSEMLRDAAYTDRTHSNGSLIGGSPQVLKVYPFARTDQFAVEWLESGRKVLTSRGRRLAHYERASSVMIDPDTGATFQPS
jgi:hypothetical protein